MEVIKNKESVDSVVNGSEVQVAAYNSNTFHPCPC